MDSRPEKSRAEVIGASAGEAALGGGGGGGSPPGAGLEGPVVTYHSEGGGDCAGSISTGVVDDG